MSEVEQKDQKSELLAVFDKALPIVDGIADSIRNAMLLGLIVAVWIFCWVFFFNEWSLTVAIVLSVIVAIPALILSRFWWSLEELKNLPEIIDDMVDDAQGEIKEGVQQLRSGNADKVGLMGSVGKLWSLKLILGDARELLGSYISIGTLANPLSLMLGAMSLLAIIVLSFIGLVLAAAAFFL